MRLFFAVPVSPATITAIREYIDDLRDTNLFRRASWVKPGAMHITIRFLGDVPDGFLGALDEWKSSLDGISPVPISVGPDIGGFPALHRPRVIFLGVNPIGPFTNIYQRLNDFLMVAGFPLDSQTFHPHLTLGRIKEPVRAGFRAHQLPLFESRPESLRQVILFKSLLTPQGAVHTPISTFDIHPES
jgi:RNA 2',3'-cyclic 3'-phosphodiesterase